MILFILRNMTTLALPWDPLPREHWDPLWSADSTPLQVWWTTSVLPTLAAIPYVPAPAETPVQLAKSSPCLPGLVKYPFASQRVVVNDIDHVSPYGGCPGGESNTKSILESTDWLQTVVDGLLEGLHT